jgi:acyl carrier protein
MRQEISENMGTINMAASNSEIEKLVFDVLAQKASIEVEKIDLESALIEDLGMDSLDAIEAVFQFEEEFGLEIDDEDIRQFEIVQDVVDYINRRLSEASAN